MQVKVFIVGKPILWAEGLFENKKTYVPVPEKHAFHVGVGLGRAP